MTIHYYGHCWNEAELVPHFIAHYRPLCERIVLYDDGSNDGTVELLEAGGVEVRPAGDAGESFCIHIAAVKSKAWEESKGKADWVIVGDLDEFLWRPEGLAEHLASLPDKVTLAKAAGYTMGTEQFPTAGPLVETCRTGKRDTGYDKPCVFRPDAFRSVEFLPGFHHGVFTPGVTEAGDKQRPLLLHYRYLGRERTWQRYQDLRSKLRAGDYSSSYGCQYYWRREWFDAVVDGAINGKDGPFA